MMKVLNMMSSLILKKSDDMILFAHDKLIRLGEILKFGNSLGVVMSIFERKQLALLLQQSEELEPITNINSLNPNPINDICTIADIKESNDIISDSKNYQKELFYRIKFKQIMNISISFILQSKEILNKLKTFDQLIYYQKLQVNKTCFKYAENQGSNYFLPKYAQQFTKQLAKTNKTLLVMDQLYDQFVVHQKLQETIQTNVYEKTTKTVYLSNLLKELSDSCGYRPGHSNLTVAVLQKDSKDDLLNDELEIEVLFKFNSTFNQNHCNLILHLQHQLNLVHLVYKSKVHYIIIQLKNFMNIMKKNQNIYRNNSYRFILINRTFINILIANQYIQRRINLLTWGSPRELLNDILGFSCSIKEFDGKSFAEYYYEKKNELDGNQFKTLIIENLGRFYGLYMLHLRMTNQLLEYKKDYI